MEAPNGPRQPVLLMPQQDANSSGAAGPGPRGVLGSKKGACTCGPRLGLQGLALGGAVVQQGAA